MMEPVHYIALGALVLNFVGTIVAVTWKISRVELSLREAIGEERREIDERLERVTHDQGERLERVSREYGETAHALRNKIHELEVFMRDTFVRREGFHKVREELSNEIKALASQLTARLDTLVSTMKKQNGGG